MKICEDRLFLPMLLSLTFPFIGTWNIPRSQQIGDHFGKQQMLVYHGEEGTEKQKEFSVEVSPTCLA